MIVVSHIGHLLYTGINWWPIFLQAIPTPFSTFARTALIHNIVPKDASLSDYFVIWFMYCVCLYFRFLSNEHCINRSRILHNISVEGVFRTPTAPSYSYLTKSVPLQVWHQTHYDVTDKKNLSVRHQAHEDND